MWKSEHRSLYMKYRGASVINCGEISDNVIALLEVTGDNVERLNGMLKEVMPAPAVAKTSSGHDVFFQQKDATLTLISQFVQDNCVRFAADALGLTCGILPESMFPSPGSIVGPLPPPGVMYKCNFSQHNRPGASDAVVGDLFMIVGRAQVEARSAPPDGLLQRASIIGLPISHVYVVHARRADVPRSTGMVSQRLLQNLPDLTTASSASVDSRPNTRLTTQHPSAAAVYTTSNMAANVAQFTLPKNMAPGLSVASAVTAVANPSARALVSRASKRKAYSVVDRPPPTPREEPPAGTYEQVGVNVLTTFGITNADTIKMLFPGSASGAPADQVFVISPDFTIIRRHHPTWADVLGRGGQEGVAALV
jgi:hypothetical protein